MERPTGFPPKLLPLLLLLPLWHCSSASQSVDFNRGSFRSPARGGVARRLSEGTFLGRQTGVDVLDSSSDSDTNSDQDSGRPSSTVNSLSWLTAERNSGGSPEEQGTPKVVASALSSSSSSNARSNQSPTDSPGKWRVQQLVDKLNGIPGQPYSNFMTVLDTSGCMTRLENMLEAFSVTILIPNNQAHPNTSMGPNPKQRTCFHILLGKWPAPVLRRLPKKTTILTLDVWPLTRVFLLKLNKPGNQFEGSPDRKVGGRLVAPNLHSTPFLTAHGIDLYLKPQKMFKGFG